MIYTFYSYKGGVGRSMALVNLAELMYQKGLDVLMVDWDLEAPGLERYYPDNVTEAALNTKGVIDMLTDYKEKVLQFQPSDNQSLFPVYDIRTYTYDIRSPRSAQSSRLTLLPAGRRSGKHFADYADRVITFDWKDFYDNWGGEIYFDWLYQELTNLADVVLIDSRTGVTEMGGVCTYQLADVIVLICAANEQNIQGTLKMIENFSDSALTEERGGRELKTLVVPSRIESTSELAILNRFRQKFSDNFTQYLPSELGNTPDLFQKLEIPYVPLYAFEELIAVTQDKESEKRSPELEESYTTILQALATLAPFDSLIRQKVPLFRRSDLSPDELLAEATCAVLIDGEIVGTAWLVKEEYLLTAGHILGTDTPRDEVEIRFADQTPQKADRAMWGYGLGIDFAVLRIDNSTNRQPLPISLSRSVTGSFRVRGYGSSLEGMVSGIGQFVGVVDPQNNAESRLFRLRSKELVEEGFSGGAVFSDELQAVVAIQIEIGRARVGPIRETVLAMPLYRIAELWPSLTQKPQRPSSTTDEQIRWQREQEEDVVITNSSPPLSNRLLLDDFLAQATCAVLIEGQIVGTAWLLTDQGHLLTAGHVLGTEDPLLEVYVQFIDDTPRRAYTIQWVFNRETGLDFSILKLTEFPPNHKPLPISFAKSVIGTCKLRGYGKTLEGQWGGDGKFLGSYYRQNSFRNCSFVLRSSEIGMPGASGGAVFSHDLGAVVAIHTEATRNRIGPGSELSLALPLYRIAQYWNPLAQLITEQKAEAVED